LTSPAPLLSALGAAIGSLAETLRAAPTVICKVERATTDSVILDILREQLQRCGPRNLTAPAFSHCICKTDSPSGSLAALLVVVSLVVVLSFLGGACLGLRCAACESTAVRPERLGAVEPSFQALVPGGARAAPQQPRILTPSAKRALA